VLFNRILHSHLENLGSFTWTSLQVNFNSSSIPHRDYNNVGFSVIVGVGKYSGGELMIDDVAHNIPGRLLAMDGNRIHYTKPFSGARYSLIAFTHGVADHATQSQERQLRALGFVLQSVDVAAPIATMLDEIDASAYPLAITTCRQLPANLADSIRVLHLLSGPAARNDGFARYIEMLGGKCDEFDILHGPSGDLADDEIWNGVMQDLTSGHYHAKLGGPPCDTFSNARSGGVRDRGPALCETSRDQIATAGRTSPQTKRAESGWALSSR